MGLVIYFIIATLAIVTGLYYNIIKQLYFTKSFLNEFEQSDLSLCTTFPELLGCEDISVHYPSGLAFIGCPEEYILNKGLVKIAYNPKTSFQFSKYSFIYLYDINHKSYKKLNIVGFPNNSTFSVHGVDCISDEKDSEIIHFFAVNHRLNNVDAIEHFIYEIGSNDLIHKQSFTGKEYQHLNSIAALSPSTFYFTQDVKTPTGIMNYLETNGMIPSGRVFHKNTKDEVSIVASGIKFANGIALSNNRNKLFVAESMGNNLNVYSRDVESGEIELEEVVKLGFIPDNVKINPYSGKIYIAGFPNNLEVYAYFKNYGSPDVKPIHAVAARVSNETGENIFYGKKYKVESLLMDNSGFFSTATVVIGLEKEGRLLISGLLTQKGVLDCPIDLNKDF